MYVMCTVSFEAPVDFDFVDALSFSSESQSAVHRGLQLSGPCVGTVPREGPAWWRGTPHTWWSNQSPGRGSEVRIRTLGMTRWPRKAFLRSGSSPAPPLSAQHLASAVCAVVSYLMEGPVGGNKKNTWLSFSLFRTAYGFVLVFHILEMKIRTTACRTMRDRLVLCRNNFQ